MPITTKLSAASRLSSTARMRRFRPCGTLLFAACSCGPCRAGTSTIGRRTRNSLPLPMPSLRASTLPPCSSTNPRTSARPIPSPPCDRSSAGATCENISLGFTQASARRRAQNSAGIARDFLHPAGASAQAEAEHHRVAVVRPAGDGAGRNDPFYQRAAREVFVRTSRDASLMRSSLSLQAVRSWSSLHPWHRNAGRPGRRATCGPGPGRKH
jgi:hypothetical protein